jgi:oleate hydratase
MYYSNGNYEAFARPRKPKGVEDKSAWVIGSGLASMAGAAFLIRDGQMPGNRITILEQQHLPGGALDGIKEPNQGFVIRGGREMEEHFECLWDLYRSIPSLEIDDASVLDEFYFYSAFIETPADCASFLGLLTSAPENIAMSVSSDGQTVNS